METTKKTVAICYDFDGTLSPDNMQEYSFIPQHLEIDKEYFWKLVRENAKKNDMDQILSYMELMIDKAKEKEKSFTKETFKENGKSIKFFEGVAEWFEQINAYAEKKNLLTEHYIISSGIKPMVEGCAIQDKFKHIFACDFKYDGNGVAKHPSVVINYTTKTQYLFRINKGILNNSDNQKINQFTPEDKRRIPFSRMIYLGDGETDVPAMKMINYQKGYSIAVYDQHNEEKKKECLELLNHERCSFIAPANYKKESPLDKIIKLLLDKISSEVQLIGLGNPLKK